MEIERQTVIGAKIADSEEELLEVLAGLLGRQDFGGENNDCDYNFVSYCPDGKVAIVSDMPEDALSAVIGGLRLETDGSAILDVVRYHLVVDVPGDSISWDLEEVQRLFGFYESEAARLLAERSIKLPPPALYNITMIT